jgi:carboxylesterase
MMDNIYPAKMSIRRIFKRVNAMFPRLIPTAEPFFFPGGPTGCLLVHGFTGSPKEMRWMGEYLSGEGYTVAGIRLAGHATRPEDLLRTRWQDWLASVEDGWHLLNAALTFTPAAQRRIFVMGLSLGGVLALILASQRYAKRCPVAGVVAMSTPFALPQDWRLSYLRLLSLIRPEVAKGPPDWHNPDAARDHIDYPAYPTRSLAELRDVLAEMRKALPQVLVPTLLVHSCEDTGVLPNNMEDIYQHLGSPNKQKLLVEDCGHVITREPERQTVYQAATSFMDGLKRQSE